MNQVISGRVSSLTYSRIHKGVLEESASKSHRSSHNGRSIVAMVPLSVFPDGHLDTQGRAGGAGCRLLSATARGVLSPADIGCAARNVASAVRPSWQKQDSKQRLCRGQHASEVQELPGWTIAFSHVVSIMHCKSMGGSGPGPTSTVYT